MDNIHTQKSFLFYLDNKDVLQLLSDQQLGRLLRLIMDFAETRELQDVDDPAVNMAYHFMTAQMRRDFEKYEQKCRRNAENGRKGGRPRIKPDASDKSEKTGGFSEKAGKAYTDTDTDTDKDTDNDTDTERDTDTDTECAAKSTQGNTSPPTLAETAAYAQSINGVTRPEIFHSFYESNGWKNKNGQRLCDWKAAYRYWNEQDKQKQPVQSAGNKKTVPESPMADAYKSLVYNLVE